MPLDKWFNKLSGVKCVCGEHEKSSNYIQDKVITAIVFLPHFYEYELDSPRYYCWLLQFKSNTREIERTSFCSFFLLFQLKKNSKDLIEAY